ncbi:MAG TPA: DNA polymerase III subunit [Gemmatimonadaceae bacterium]|nr:DNA polymerase III subunit [Gemmatimonadaceae bacterium]
MPIVDLYGHEALRARLTASVHAHTLPASLLFHGPHGVGKQRLAIWLAQTILCREPTAPCGKCASCRYGAELTHPDLHWVFPRPRLKDSDPDLEQVRADYAEGILERVNNYGLYAPPSGTEGIYVATVRSLVQRAAMAPAIGDRKVFIVGDAERMVPQEGSDMAANAFLKLLEEPPADTTIILTSSEPGALLPTIRSRVAAVRVPLVSEKAVRAFVDDAGVRKVLDKLGKASSAERVRIAAGAPGKLLGGESNAKATMNARRIVEAATGYRHELLDAVAMAQGTFGARGTFAETIEALVELLGERARDALHRDDVKAAAAASRAVDAVLKAGKYTETNVSPQLITSRLVRELAATLK